MLFSVRECIDQVSVKEGRALVRMMSEIDMFLVNGRAPGDCPGQLTFSSQLGVSTVDLC